METSDRARPAEAECEARRRAGAPENRVPMPPLAGAHAATTRSAPPAQPSTEARRRALQAAVDGRVAEGWRVTAQTDVAAQLAKPTRLSKLLFLLVAFGVVRGILQPLLLLAGRERQLSMTVDEDGRVREAWR
jgi:hypothetical protein